MSQQRAGIGLMHLREFTVFVRVALSMCLWTYGL